jgi:hypothetical protein
VRGIRQQELTLIDRPKKDDAQAQFKKLQRAEDGKKAMAEYEAENLAIRAKTERLKAARLARDAAAAKAPPKAAASPAKKPVKKKAKGKSPSLSDYLKDQKTDGRGD